ncbi:MAG TPA: D-alanyl-D-alanine carboxypeptidase/D-alanyl-D-alanine-endopeptidase [Nocardioides sp.]|uniref:D-alanyl-D-alanine carboxypeptidase/D-alanyl-D-alanine endopeptidase n=1 Tax=Nocardioides sp. TaxID=35761 RepID=UPI002E315E6E|nr:D-alanyl-D-alanine carboxypeptidase/D-alanyl-D-alanine-endopeptidase [Nocardioides sp.]HEX5087859.1 D-alanyl-D-alanine carboxypeptidase/D-alanyl-D-alanine-endopeptidase [Nocardioides sp.]
MAARDRGHGALGRAVVALVVVALLLGGVAAWRLDLVGRLGGGGEADTGTPAGPAAVPPPPGLELPPLTDPAPVGSALTPPGRIDPALVQAAVAPYLADPVLGKHVVGAVADLTAGRPVVRVGGGGAAMPASTTKLFTTTAALSVLGPEARFTTRVVAGGKGRIVLVGGGDPFLASKPLPSAYPQRADVATLAAQTASALKAEGRTRVRLGYDDSLFSEPSFNPAWPAHYLPEHVVSRVTALWVDEGRPSEGSGRVDDPSLYAAQTFAAALAANGIKVVGSPAHGVASGGRELAAVQSAPLREIVAHILEVSDNEGAEVVSHQVGVAVAHSGTFADGAATVTTTLQGLGVTAPFAIHDGSGLSRENRVTPLALVQVLRLTLDPAHPELNPIATALPVAGFTGSLTNRFDKPFPDSRGLVRAKTGTLTNVSSLAGIAVDQDGHEMLFALLADRIDKPDETKAQHALDAAAGALGACHCGAGEQTASR